MNKIKNKILAFFHNKSVDNLYNIDGCVPLLNAIPFGLQHIISMFVSNITPVLLVIAITNMSSAMKMSIIQNAIFIAGLATLIQLFPIWKVGTKLPVISGISFTFVGVLINIVENFGYSTALGAILIGGFILLILGIFTKYWSRLISPLVTGCVILGLGLSLISSGVLLMAGNGSNAYPLGSYQHLIVAFITLLAYLICNYCFKRSVKKFSILISIGVGYVSALFFKGMIDFSVFENMSIISIPKLYPLNELKFNIGAIIPVVIIFIVSSTEIIGAINATTKEALGRMATLKEIEGAIIGNGIMCQLESLFGVIPVTIYSQNIGIVSETKVINRYTLATGAIILILISFFPPVSLFLQTIPAAVIGGSSIMLFASIAVSGLQMVTKNQDKRSLIILMITIAIGYGITLNKELLLLIFKNETNIVYLICSSPVSSMFIVSLILDLLIKKDVK